MVDQVTNEVVAYILVVLVIAPGDRELFRAECAGHPEQEQVAAVVMDAVDDPLPIGKVIRGHPHEGDVVATLCERSLGLCVGHGYAGGEGERGCEQWND
jgi:hypothetical protein